MKIASMGDFHYGNGMDEDIEYSLSIVTRKIKEERVGLIVITGDVYHGKSSVESRNIVKERIKYLAQVAPVIIIYGNHDYPGDLDIMSDLMAAHPIKVYNDLAFVECGDVNVFTLPWINKSEWMKGHALEGMDNINKNLSSSLINLLASKKKQWSTKYPDRKNVIFGHILISGSRAENNQPLIGEGLSIGEYDLEEAGFDMAILGHIHLKQELANGRTIYNGSPAAMDFGEKSDKYFSVYNSTDNTIVWHQIPAIKRITISGKFVGGEWTKTCDTPLNMIKDSRLRITYNISVVEDQLYAKNVICNKFMDYSPREIKLNPIVETQIRTRSEEVSKAKTLKNKMIEFWKATDSVPEAHEAATILDKLNRLETMCTTKELPLGE